MPPSDSSDEDDDSVPGVRDNDDEADSLWNSAITGWLLPRLPTDANDDTISSRSSQWPHSTTISVNSNYSFSDDESLVRSSPGHPPGQRNRNSDPPGYRYDSGSSANAAASLSTTTLPERTWPVHDLWVRLYSYRMSHHDYAAYWTDSEDGWSDGEARDYGDDWREAELTVTVLESGRDSNDDDDDDNGTPLPGHVFPQINSEPWQYYNNDNNTDDHDTNVAIQRHHHSLSVALATGGFPRIDVDPWQWYSIFQNTIDDNDNVPSRLSHSPSHYRALSMALATGRFLDGS